MKHRQKEYQYNYVFSYGVNFCFYLLSIYLSQTTLFLHTGMRVFRDVYLDKSKIIPQ